MNKIRIDEFLVQKGLCESREKAKRAILAGEVLVNEIYITKPGMIVDIDSVTVRIKQKDHFVSRAAHKLEEAFAHVTINLEDKIALDVGSSTGGFTQLLLEKGVKKVYAVDSGINQLHYSLRINPKIIVLEKTNARYLNDTLIPDPIDIMTIDVSFISVTKILPAVFPLMKENAYLIVLIKPQFELERSLVGNKGLVNEKNHPKAISKIENFLKENNCKSVCPILKSPIKGAKSGNQEYLAVYQKG